MCTVWYWGCVSHMYVAWFLHLLKSCGLSYLSLGCKGQSKEVLGVNDESSPQEKKTILYQNQKLQKELEAINVSVAYIHQVYNIMKSCFLWPIRGSCECKLLACPGTSGRSFKSCVSKNNLNACTLTALSCHMLYPWLDGSEMIPVLSCTPKTHFARTVNISAKLLILR